MSSVLCPSDFEPFVTPPFPHASSLHHTMYLYLYKKCPSSTDYLREFLLIFQARLAQLSLPPIMQLAMPSFALMPCFSYF